MLGVAGGADAACIQVRVGCGWWDGPALAPAQVRGAGQLLPRLQAQLPLAPSILNFSSTWM